MNIICLNKLSHMGIGEGFLQQEVSYDEDGGDCGRPIQVLMLVVWDEELSSCLKLPVMKSPLPATCFTDLS